MRRSGRHQRCDERRARPAGSRQLRNLVVLLLLPSLLVLLVALGRALASDGSAPTVAAPASSPTPASAPVVATAGGKGPGGSLLGQQRQAAGEPGRGAGRFFGVIGYLFIIGLCYLLSTDRKRIRWRTVGWAIALQVLFASIVLNPVVGQFFFDKVDAGVRALLGFADAGIDFVFQATVPHQVTYQDGHQAVTRMFVGQMSPALKSVAFSVLPTVIFFSALITLLYHLNVMQWVVRGMARAMVYAMRTSGAETLSCTANIFVGQTEAPLLVRPFIERMTDSELMAVMTGGFATVAGGVLAIYVGLLADVPGIAGHLVTASIMAAPAALGVAKLLHPETGEPVTAGAVDDSAVERPDRNAIEAVARGATEGMQLFLNIVAMLIAFVGLVALINALLGMVGTSLEQLLGWCLSPMAWLIGVPWAEATVVGELLGKKLVLTELLAYSHLKGMLGVLSGRSAVIASYALCGFANVASIGIQIGGIGGMAPSRRGDLARIGLKAMFAGALVSCMSGAIAGILI